MLVFRTITLNLIAGQKMVGISYHHHSIKLCTSEEKADMWFLGQMLYAVESTNPVS